MGAIVLHLGMAVVAVQLTGEQTWFRPPDPVDAVHYPGVVSAVALQAVELVDLAPGSDHWGWRKGYC